MPDDRLDHTFGYEQVTPAERQRRIRAVFDAVATRYDRMNDIMSLGIHRLWKRRLVTGLPLRGMTVDLAGGTGDVARLLCRVPERAVIVCDPSLAMMAVGRARGGGTQIRWLGGEAEGLPFADGSVAALTIAFGLRNTTRPERALAEIARVLAPDGVFACLEFSRPHRWLRPFYDMYSRFVIPRLGAFVAREPAAYRYLVESIRRFPDQRRFADMIAAAGLRSVAWKNLSFGIACIHRGSKPAAGSGDAGGAA